MLQVEVISTESGFAKLRERWDELVENSENPNPFMSWAWLYSWWKYYSDGGKLQILTVWCRHRLVGIAPFFEETKRWFKILPLRKISFIADRFVTSEYQDIIASRRMATEVRFVICRYLARQWRHGWDVLMLSSAPEFSQTLNELSNALNVAHFQVFDPVTCYYTALPGTYEQYLSSLTRKWRYNVKKKRRSMSNVFSLEFCEPRLPKETGEMLEALVTIHRLGRTARGKEFSFQSKRFGRFMGEVCRLFFEASRLELNLLKANGEAVSGIIAFRMADRLFVYQQGVHPEYFKWSPGIIIFSHCIESAIAKGIKEIDFLRGDEEYKKHWASQERKSLRLWVVNKTLRGLILTAFLRCGQLVSATVPKRVRSRARQL